jgi:hypothetical protein
MNKKFVLTLYKKKREKKVLKKKSKIRILEKLELFLNN